MLKPSAAPTAFGMWIGGLHASGSRARSFATADHRNARFCRQSRTLHEQQRGTYPSGSSGTS
eukprot:10594218-Alexandrium_andersonii.AAC.1